MLNSTIQLKIKEALNKLSSDDYTNIKPWQFVMAFNKGMVDWCRRNLHGTNQKQEGDEQSKRRIDDLQILLTDPTPLVLVNKPLYAEALLPADYFEWKRVSAIGTKGCCDKRPFVIYLTEEANIDVLLRDENKKPNFSWGETFAVLGNNKVLVYTNGDFEISDAQLIYYKQPIRIEIAGVTDPYTGLTPVVDVLCQFKDDIVEIFCSEAAKILAGDMESGTAMQIQTQSTELNN